MSRKHASSWTHIYGHIFLKEAISVLHLNSVHFCSTFQQRKNKLEKKNHDSFYIANKHYK